MIRHLTALFQSKSEVWRSPVFRREAGLLGRSGRKRWRNPIWRTTFFCLLMLVGAPLLCLMLEKTWGWREENLALTLTGGYILLAIFIPPIVMNRRVVKLIKTGQLEHLSLTLTGPDEILKSFIWSNVLKFWPLVPSGVIGIAAFLISSGEFPLRKFDDLLLIVFIAIFCTSWVVIINPLFSLWVTWRFYRTGITLLFLLPGLVALDVCGMYAIALPLAIIRDWLFDWIWVPVTVGVCVVIWCVLWGHARAYMDGNYIEELTGGRDTPHRPYGERMWLMLPLLKPLLGPMRRQGTLRQWRKWFLAAWMVAVVIPLASFGLLPKATELELIVITVCCLSGGLLFLLFFNRAFWNLFAPCPLLDSEFSHEPDGEPAQHNPGFRRTFPLPVAQLIFIPQIFLIGAGAFVIIVIFEAFNFRGFFDYDQDSGDVFALGACAHLLFFMVALPWLAARRWRRGGHPEGFVKAAAVMIVVMEAVFTLAAYFISINWDVEYSYRIRSDWDRFLSVWLPLTVAVLAPLAGIMFLKILKILRENGIRIRED